MADETPRPDIVVPAAYSGPIIEIRNRWKRKRELDTALINLINADIDICDECRKEIEAAAHDEGVAVDAIVSALNIRCVLVHKTCRGPHKPTATDIVAGTCVCGAKIVVDGERDV